MAGTTKDAHPTSWSKNISDLMHRHNLNPSAWAERVKQSGFEVSAQSIYNILQGTSSEPSVTIVYMLAAAVGEGIGQFYPYYNPQKSEHALALHFIHRMARLRLTRQAMAALLGTDSTKVSRFLSFQQVPAVLYQAARALSTKSDAELAALAVQEGFTVRELSGATTSIKTPVAFLQAEMVEPEPEGDDWHHPGALVPGPRPAVRVEVPLEKRQSDLNTEYTLDTKPTPPAEALAQPEPQPPDPPVPPEPPLAVVSADDNNFDTAIWSIVQGLAMIARLEDPSENQLNLVMKIGAALEYTDEVLTDDARAQLALLEIITDPTALTVDKFRRILKGMSGTMTILSDTESDGLAPALAEAVRAALDALPEV